MPNSWGWSRCALVAVTLALGQLCYLQSTALGRNAPTPMGRGDASYPVLQSTPADDGSFTFDEPVEWSNDDFAAPGCVSPDGPCNLCGDAPCACSRPCCARPRRGAALYGEWLYLRPTGADVTHAQQQNGTGGTGTVPFGTIDTADMEYNSGFRVGGIVPGDACSGVAFSYTHFESDTFSDLQPPTIVGGGGAVGSLVQHPGAAITASVGPVHADYAIDFQLADVMYRHLWRSTPCYSIHYMLGAQYGNLEQSFFQTGQFGGGSAGVIDTSTSIGFDGGGLKIGIEGERRLGARVSAYGRLTAAAMSGKFSTHYTMLNSTTDVLLAQADWQDNRIVSHFQYEVGLGWTSCNGHWRTSAGYMFSYWGNVVTTPELIDAVQADNYVDVGDTISFDGLVTRVELRW